jgi:hypothetical protein
MLHAYVHDLLFTIPKEFVNAPSFLAHTSIVGQQDQQWRLMNSGQIFRAKSNNKII